MSETTFVPRGKNAKVAEARMPDENEIRPEPITERPKASKSEQLLQHKRERAGLGIMQLLAFGAGLLGRAKILPVLPEDVAAIALHSPPIAKGMADCAAEDAKFAKVFDRITAMGPYGALLEPIVALAMQITANHNQGVRSGNISAEQFGAMPPDTLLAMMESSGNGDGASSS